MSKWKIWPNLYDFQKKVVQDSYKIPKVGYWLSMGLGKTFTSLGWNEVLYGDPKNKVDKTIVIGLSKSQIDWKIAVNKFHKDWNFFTLNSKKRENDVVNETKGLKGAAVNSFIIKKWSEKGGILYMGHRQITNYIDDLLKVVNDTVANITDESQSYKDFNSKSTKMWLKLMKKIDYIRLLSGTPRGNSNEDLYTQLKALGYEEKYDEWKTLTSFKEHYLKMIQLPRSYVKIPKGQRNTEELFERAREKGIFIKTEEVHELPPKTFIDIHFEDDSIKWKQIAKDKIYEDKKSGETFIFDTPVSRYLMARQASSGIIGKDDRKSIYGNGKLEALKELLGQANDKFVIFYEWNLEWDTITNMLKGQKIPFYSVRGGADEHRAFVSFPVSNDKRMPVLLCQYKAASKGINLQTGGIKRLIYYTPTNSFENYAQSQKRIHRIGQVNPVFYYRLINTTSIDKNIYERIEENEDYDAQLFEKQFG